MRDKSIKYKWFRTSKNELQRHCYEEHIGIYSLYIKRRRRCVILLSLITMRYLSFIFNSTRTIYFFYFHKDSLHYRSRSLICESVFMQIIICNLCHTWERYRMKMLVTVYYVFNIKCDCCFGFVYVIYTNSIK